MDRNANGVVATRTEQRTTAGWLRTFGIVLVLALVTGLGVTLAGRAGVQGLADLAAGVARWGTGAFGHSVVEMVGTTPPGPAELDDDHVSEQPAHDASAGTDSLSGPWVHDRDPVGDHRSPDPDPVPPPVPPVQDLTGPPPGPPTVGELLPDSVTAVAPVDGWVGRLEHLLP